MKILIADDEIGIQKVLGHYMSSEGHEMFFTNCGDEVCHISQRESINLIFLDYYVLGINGKQVVEKLWHSKVPAKVIIFSGADIESLKSHFENYNNVIGFMSKPFDLGDVKRFLENASEEALHHKQE